MKLSILIMPHNINPQWYANGQGNKASIIRMNIIPNNGPT